MISTKVSQLGNTLCVPIPKEIRDATGMVLNQPILLTIGVGGHIIIIQVPDKGNLNISAAVQDLPTIDYENRDNRED